MNRYLRVFGGVAVATMLFTASASLAQEHAPPSPEQREARMHEHMEMRAHKLHDLLNIRPDQEQSFHALLTALTPPPHEPRGEHDEHGDHGDHDKMMSATTPERLDWMAKRMSEHQARFQQHAEAIKQFYAVLSPEQKRAFDALPPMMGGEHEGHKGMGGPGMGGPGMGHDGPRPE